MKCWLNLVEKKIPANDWFYKLYQMFVDSLRDLKLIWKPVDTSNEIHHFISCFSFSHSYFAFKTNLTSTNFVNHRWLNLKSWWNPMMKSYPMMSPILWWNPWTQSAGRTKKCVSVINSNTKSPYLLKYVKILCKNFYHAGLKFHFNVYFLEFINKQINKIMNTVLQIYPKDFRVCW